MGVKDFEAWRSNRTTMGMATMTLQYVSPAQLNDSISLFEVRTHYMAWFALHNDIVYVLDTLFI